MTRSSAAASGGTLVLDSEGLAKAVLRDHTVAGRLALARADDLRVITSAATLVEVVHPRINRPALEWTLSRLVIEPVACHSPWTSPGLRPPPGTVGMPARSSPAADTVAA